MWSPRILTLVGCAQLGKGLIKGSPGRGELKTFQGLGTQRLHGVRALGKCSLFFGCAESSLLGVGATLVVVRGLVTAMASLVVHGS